MWLVAMLWCYVVGCEHCERSSSSCHLSVFWASPIQSIYTHPTSWRSILTLSTLLRLGLLSGLLPSGFPSNISVKSVLFVGSYYIRISQYTVQKTKGTKHFGIKNSASCHTMYLCCSRDSLHEYWLLPQAALTEGLNNYNNVCSLWGTNLVFRL